MDLAIVVFACSGGKYINQILDGIFSQKCNFKYEVIVSYDESSGDSIDAIRQFQDHDNLKLVPDKSNQSFADCYRTVLSKIRAKYVLINYGDTYFTDNHLLQEQYDYLEQHADCSVCFHPCMLEYESELSSGHKNCLFPLIDGLEKHNYSFCLYDLLQHNFMQRSSVMYRWRFNSEDFESVFPKSCQPCDWLMSLLHSQKGKIHAIANSGSVCRVSIDSSPLIAGFNSREFVDENALDYINFIQYIDDEILPINKDKINLILCLSARYLRNCLMEDNIDGLKFFGKNYRRWFNAVLYCLLKNYRFKVLFPYSISMGRVLKKFKTMDFEYLIKEKIRNRHAVSLLISRLNDFGNDYYKISAKM